jgi:predicted acylesterase/phospholipase RssA
LGGGGARGLAHISVIQWLTENGYIIRSIAGSSMGALVGGIYATSKLDVYAEWVMAIERMDVVRLLDPAFSRTIARLKIAANLPDVIVEIPRNACGYHEFWRAKELIALGRERTARAFAARGP